MKIDTAGTYTLRYSATDQCGNVATKDRVLTVAAPRTVLYADGTFIINELPTDMERNEQLHGAATDVYEPFDPVSNTYAFTSMSERPWHSKASAIKSFVIGSPIEPTKTSYWLSKTVAETYDFTNLIPTNFTNASYMFSQYDSAYIDVSTLDTKNVITMERMFSSCSRVDTLNLSGLNTRQVTNMNGMFANWTSSGHLTTLDLSGFDTPNLQKCGSMFESSYHLRVIDLSSFDTSNVTNMWGMFNLCQHLATIYASDLFVTTNVTDRMSTDMFANNTGIHNLVGGAGTAWSSSNPTNKTYARIDNPPDAPGYFTAKTA